MNILYRINNKKAVIIGIAENYAQVVYENGQLCLENIKDITITEDSILTRLYSQPFNGCTGNIL